MRCLQFFIHFKHVCYCKSTINERFLLNLEDFRRANPIEALKYDSAMELCMFSLQMSCLRLSVRIPDAWQMPRDS